MVLIIPFLEVTNEKSMKEIGIFKMVYVIKYVHRTCTLYMIKDPPDIRTLTVVIKIFSFFACMMVCYIFRVLKIKIL